MCNRLWCGITSAVLVLFVCLTPATSDIIAAHNGSTDPTLQSWTTVPGPGGGVAVGSIDDGGTAAWFVDDNSTAPGSIFFYEQNVANDDILDGNNNGWTLSTTLRVASDEAVAFDGSPFLGYRDGVSGWEMEFGLNASGDTFVRLFTGATTGPVHTLSGNSTFNQYSLVYDPVALSADLFVNGTEVISDYTGFSSSDTRVLWGAGRSPDSAQGNYSQVSFSTASVPEPSSFSLAIVVASLVSYRRLRQRHQPME